MQRHGNQRLARLPPGAARLFLTAAAVVDGLAAALAGFAADEARAEVHCQQVIS